MAKQLLGKEVTAALNEKIKANVAELQGKGVNPTPVSYTHLMIYLAKTRMWSSEVWQLISVQLQFLLY